MGWPCLTPCGSWDVRIIALSSDTEFHLADKDTPDPEELPLCDSPLCQATPVLHLPKPPALLGLGSKGRGLLTSCRAL